jgi:hypothetical protein
MASRSRAPRDAGRCCAAYRPVRGHRVGERTSRTGASRQHVLFVPLHELATGALCPAYREIVNTPRHNHGGPTLLAAVPSYGTRNSPSIWYWLPFEQPPPPAPVPILRRRVLLRTSRPFCSTQALLPHPTAPPSRTAAIASVTSRARSSSLIPHCGCRQVSRAVAAAVTISLSGCAR